MQRRVPSQVYLARDEKLLQMPKEREREFSESSRALSDSVLTFRSIPLSLMPAPTSASFL